MIDIQDLEQAEEFAEKGLAKDLQEHINLCKQAITTSQRVLDAIPTEPIDSVLLSKKVCICLMIRLQNDLRSSWILAAKGYTNQSVGLVASMLEVAWTIATIGSDEAIAEEWTQYQNPTKSFRRVPDLMLLGLRRLGHADPVKQKAIEYRIYRQLCWSKHANPWYQKRFGVYFDGKSYSAIAGPNIANESIQSAWFALEHAVNAVYVALSAFTIEHISDLVKERILTEIDFLGRERRRLGDRGLQRWGGEDPFPGKW